MSKAIYLFTILLKVKILVQVYYIIKDLLKIILRKKYDPLCKLHMVFFQYLTQKALSLIFFVSS